MSAPYYELLEALARHVEDLKSQGVRSVPLAVGRLEALDAVPRRSARATPPASSDNSRPAPMVVKPIIEPQVQDKLQKPVSIISDSAETTPVAAALSKEEKTAAMAELRERARACQKCPHLVRSRKSVVFGVGDIHSPLMFAGEAPGADEDTQGEPFVGKAGQLLTRIIQTMGFSRETVYIANVLKCRPDTPGQTMGNRKPTLEEMKTCLPYLLEQIDLIQPKVIVALGGTAVEGLLGNTVGITRLRGHFQTLRGIPVMPTYHPSYLLRSDSPNVKREVWEDMLQVMEKLGVPITEKHRNYFRGK
jgi:uracil-DNA glycosylase family 4